MPENTVYVGRGSRWGNPFVLGETQMREPRSDGEEGVEYEGRLHKVSGVPQPYFHDDGRVTWHHVRDATREECVELFREYVTRKDLHLLDWGGESLDLEPLRGRNLACWCPLDVPCHADVLLELAND